MYTAMTREFKTPGNVITSLRADHRPGQENASPRASQGLVFSINGVENMINYPCGWFDVEQLPGGSNER